MKQKECPSCAMEIDADEKVCPVCGYEFPQSNTGYRWIAVFLILLLMVFLFYSMFY